MDRSNRRHTIAEVCAEYDVTARTVREWTRRGLPSSGREKGRRWDIREVRDWLRSNNLTGRPGRQPSPMSPELLAARVKKERALADKHELFVARELAKLVPVEDVERRWVAICAVIRDAAMAIPNCAPEIVGKSAGDIQRILDRVVYETLDFLSKQ